MIRIPFLQLGVVRLGPDQRQVVSTRIGSMLHAELAGGSSGSIDHLGIVVVTLRIYLVAQVLLINVLSLVALTSNGVHHVGPSADMWTSSSFE